MSGRTGSSLRALSHSSRALRLLTGWLRPFFSMSGNTVSKKNPAVPLSHIGFGMAIVLTQNVFQVD